jgi:hypothetical protein
MPFLNSNHSFDLPPLFSTNTAACPLIYMIGDFMAVSPLESPIPFAFPGRFI